MKVTHQHIQTIQVNLQMADLTVMCLQNQMQSKNKEGRPKNPPMTKNL
jgi:hypothetical protein